MKKFLLLTGSLAMFLISLSTTAQPIITAASFKARAAFIDSIYSASLSSVTGATLGANQTWDYSGAISTGLGQYPNYDAVDSTAYPNAFSFTRDDLFVFGAPVETYRFDALDNMGRYTSSLYIKEFTLPLSGITGGASDHIKVLRQRSIYSGRMDYIQFPVDANSSWTGTKTYSNNFEITVASYNLTQTPGALKASETQAREVVGYGNLILPDENGAALPPVEALLIKVTRTVVDSVFLGGAPAPAALLNAFGLVQGSARVNTFYVFYAPGFHQPLATFSYDAGGGIELFAWRPDGLRKAKAYIGLHEYSLRTTSFFPNPAKAGEAITLNLDNTAEVKTISLYTLSGKEVHSAAVTQKNTDKAQMNIPVNIPSGLYLLSVKNKNNKTIAHQKIVVQ